MPMQLTISRSRKRSRHYDSEGHGISLTVELDQCLLDQPDKLQVKVSELYHQADAALDQQAVTWPDHAPSQNGRPVTNGNGRLNGNGHAPNSNGRRSRQSDRADVGTMSKAQRRAIDSIAERVAIDASAECLRLLNQHLDQLTVREASSLIDHLKRLEQTARQNASHP